MDTPIFERDGERFVATELARGPWDPGSCHGGAPAALLAAAIDAAATLVDMQVVRLTYDLQRPVPTHRPLDLTVEVTRDGKRIQVLDASLSADGVELVRCRALKIRVAELRLPEDRPRSAPGPTTSPEQLERFAGIGGELEGFWRAVDVRFVSGMLNRPGAGQAWFRVIAPLADGVELTPIARVAAAADFGNGIGAPLAMGPHVYINPDITVAVHRLPVGDWVASRAAAVAEEHGIGLATAELSDERGVIGTGLQTLFIDDAMTTG